MNGFVFMKSVTLFLLSFIIIAPLRSQSVETYENPLWAFDLLRQTWEDNGDFYSLEKKLEQDSIHVIPAFRDYYGQALMTVQTFNGNIEGKDQSNISFRNPIKKLKKSEVADDGVHAVGAAAFLLEHLQNQQILMFNEAHLYPQHRAFICSLLPALYKLGYKHLFMETLSRKKQVHSYPERDLGIYTNEPVMANLLRISTRVGFKLHSYDGYEYANRDSASAQNILRVVRENPDDKFIVLCGFEHNNEKKKHTLAYYLSQTINPFTVDLTLYSEPESSAHYGEMIRHYQISVPSVLVDIQNRSIAMRNSDGRDLYVITPPSLFVDGYPDWMVNSGDNKWYVNGFEDYDMVEVYLLDEINNVSMPVPYSVKYKTEVGVEDRLLIPLKSCSLRFYILEDGKKKLIKTDTIYVK